MPIANAGNTILAGMPARLILSRPNIGGSQNNAHRPNATVAAVIRIAMMSRMRVGQ